MISAESWPSLSFRVEDDWEDMEPPDWVKELVCFGQWIVAQSSENVSWRAALVLPVRKSSALWISLGGILGVLQDGAPRQAQCGAKVWLLPKPGRKWFREGMLDRIEGGFHWISLNDGCEGRRRSEVFFVQSRPTLEQAKAADATEALARQLGMDIPPGRCLEAESSIFIGGSKHATKELASVVKLNGHSIEQLLLLSSVDVDRFSMTRVVNETEEVGSNARLLIIDGPSKLHLLEDVRASSGMLPAVVVLSEEEWFQAQAADSSRIQNAFVNWAGERHDWPDGLPKVGLGGVVYTKRLAG